MLLCLMDGHARTATELAVVAEVSPSTASVHIGRLKTERLVKLMTRGKHRFYSLDGQHVANAIEGLTVLAGGTRDSFVPTTPPGLRLARTCYDHVAGLLGVRLHDSFEQRGWLTTQSPDTDSGYELTRSGTDGLQALGIDVASVQSLRRRFAFPCLDWSERRPHLGGALGAAVLSLGISRRWLTRQLDGRALDVTSVGRRELLARFGIAI